MSTHLGGDDVGFRGRRDDMCPWRALTSLAETAHGAVHDAFTKTGRKCVIAMTSLRFTVMRFVVRQAPVIVTMHARLAQVFGESMGLAVSPATIDLPDVSISMIWHASNDAVPG